MGARYYSYYNDADLPQPLRFTSRRSSQHANTLDKPKLKVDDQDIDKLQKILEDKKPKAKPVVEPNHNKVANLIPMFWFVLALLVLVPLTKSSIANLWNLGENLSQNIQLSRERDALIQDKIKLNDKIKQYHSWSGMKRTIKEEIKVIEKNEILIKIGK